MNILTKIDWSWMETPNGQPLSVAHRGASGHAFANSFEAFEKAIALGADMLEVDIRCSKDGFAYVQHDADLLSVCGKDVNIADLTRQEISSLSTFHGAPIPEFEDIVKLAKAHDVGIYVDAKSKDGAFKAIDILLQHQFEYAAIGSFDIETCQALKANDCPYPVATLIPVGEDPFDYAARSQADIIHLCWENACPQPQFLIDEDLMQRASEKNLKIMLWHEERPEVIGELLGKRVLGICSDKPEMLKPYNSQQSRTALIVCHRGANLYAPENTLHAAELAYGMGMDVVEIDVQTTRDGKLVVIHDQKIDRTSNGQGLVCDFTFDELKSFDFGSWYSPFFKAMRIESLSAFIDLTKRYDRQLYIELKETAEAQDVLNTVVEADFLDNCFFWSFDQEKLKTIRKCSSQARLMARRQDYASLSETIASFDAEIVEFAYGLDDMAEIETCKSLGIKSMIAYNGQDIEALKTIYDQNPDLVNLNNIIRFAEICATGVKKELQ
ncbi:MAG: glycerophosphodiester phosphodiesterase family protein [Alphaproteobacteria bacterium]|nr:glycerophosphodiester phosphodiesterase family protein [Alphaproteobacteria bacterium]